MTDIGTRTDNRRQAWLERTLATIPAGARILDAGAGELRNKKWCEHLTYVAQDFAQYDGSGDGSGLQSKSWDQSKLDIVSDIVAIPEERGSFDAILCSEVFEHIPEPVLAIKEFARLLKPGGALILTAPFTSMSHMAPFHFATGFSKYFYEHHLPQHGFAIQEITHNGDFFEFLATEVRRVPVMVGRYANYTTKGLGRIQKLTYQVQSALYRMAVLPFMLNLLSKYEKIDTGSHEFCTGTYHVVAKKI